MAGSDQPRAHILPAYGAGGHDASVAVTVARVAGDDGAADPIRQGEGSGPSAGIGDAAVASSQLCRLSGASMPCSRMRWLWISSVSPSITVACPENEAPAAGNGCERQKDCEDGAE